MKNHVHHRVIHRLFAAVLILTMLFCMGSSVFASNTGTTGPVADSDTQTGSITYNFTADEYPAEGVTFLLYKVGTMSSSGSFVPADADAGVTNLEDDYAAELMAAYYMNKTPLQKQITDEFGDCRFAGLEDGVYLILADETGDEPFFTTPDGIEYTASPLLVTVPEEDPTSPDGYSYDVMAYGKPVLASKYVVTIQKKWKGDSTDKRPESLTVYLLCNNKKYEEVKLTAENNWSYTWVDLDPKMTWTATEPNVPTGYVMSYADDSKRIIVNTYSSSSLPKTGQLWWPVWLLTGLGFVCIVLGILAGRKQRAAHQE